MNKEASLKQAGRHLGDAMDAEADCLVTPCPLCHLNLDLQQPAGRRRRRPAAEHAGAAPAPAPRARPRAGAEGAGDEQARRQAVVGDRLVDVGGGLGRPRSRRSRARWRRRWRPGSPATSPRRAAGDARRRAPELAEQARARCSRARAGTSTPGCSTQRRSSGRRRTGRLRTAVAADLVIEAGAARTSSSSARSLGAIDAEVDRRPTQHVVAARSAKLAESVRRGRSASLGVHWFNPPEWTPGIEVIAAPGQPPRGRRRGDRVCARRQAARPRSPTARGCRRRPRRRAPCAGARRRRGRPRQRPGDRQRRAHRRRRPAAVLARRSSWPHGRARTSRRWRSPLERT